MQKQAGQSLIEVIVALTITIMMIVALIAFVLTGLKNAQLAQNQSRATKFAQEAMDQIKTIRDRNGEIDFTVSPTETLDNFSELFGIQMSGTTYCNQSCYFKFETNGALVEEIGPAQTNLGDGFKREIIIEDAPPLDSETEKRVIVKIKWADSSGEHESNIQTILTPVNWAI